MDCDETASKIANRVRSLKGAENVTVDRDYKKSTVEGKVDSLQIRDGLRRRTTLAAGNIKEDNNSDDERPDAKKKDTKSATKEDDEKFRDELSDIRRKGPVTATKEDEGKTNQKYLERTIVVLKLRHYCQGCIQEIEKILWRTIGVEEILADEATEMVIIKGTMDSKTLIGNLKELKKPFEVVPIGKEKNAKGSIHGKKESNIEMELEKAPAIIAVYKVSFHCAGCKKKVRKRIQKIIGVQRVIINKDETITVIGTAGVKILTETIRILVGEGKIEILKGAQVVTEAISQYSPKKAHKQ